jgi:hypothetical protein
VAEQDKTDRLDEVSTTNEPRPTGRHDTDVTSLVFGLLFLGVAVMWALVESDVVSWPDASGIFPVLLVVAGVIGLVSSVRRSRRSRAESTRPMSQ